MHATILLVEDEVVSRRALTTFLEDEGYSVAVVASGEAALRLMGDHHSFDAVITNLELSGSVDGLDVLKQFERTNPGRCRILISGNTVLQSSCDLDGAVFLPKPLDLEELLRTVRAFPPTPPSVRWLFALLIVVNESVTPPFPKITPIIPIRRSTVFEDVDWTYELKYDGFRALAYLGGGQCRLISRRGNQLKRFDGLCRSIGKTVRAPNAVMDGEIVALDNSGMPAFNDLLQRKSRIVYFAFDLLCWTAMICANCLC